jgi:predicted transcriptional regulator
MTERGSPTDGLGPREGQILNVLFRLGRATASQVLERLEDPPSYSTVRKLLAILEQKGHVRHGTDGIRYIYEPTLRPESARRSALKHLLGTFFGGSDEELVVTLLSTRRLSAGALSRLSGLIEAERKARAPTGGQS